MVFSMFTVLQPTPQSILEHVHHFQKEMPYPLAVTPSMSPIHPQSIGDLCNYLLPVSIGFPIMENIFLFHKDKIICMWSSFT